MSDGWLANLFHLSSTASPSAQKPRHVIAIGPKGPDVRKDLPLQPASMATRHPRPAHSPRRNRSHPGHRHRLDTSDLSRRSVSQKLAPVKEQSCLDSLIHLIQRFGTEFNASSNCARGVSLSLVTRLDVSARLFWHSRPMVSPDAGHISHSSDRHDASWSGPGA